MHGADVRDAFSDVKCGRAACWRASSWCFLKLLGGHLWRRSVPTNNYAVTPTVGAHRLRKLKVANQG